MWQEWKRFDVLPRAGDMLDQDPTTVATIRICEGVLGEHQAKAQREQERKLKAMQSEAEKAKRGRR